jgi:hypothetical protein
VEVPASLTSRGRELLEELVIELRNQASGGREGKPEGKRAAVGK